MHTTGNDKASSHQLVFKPAPSFRIKITSLATKEGMIKE